MAKKKKKAKSRGKRKNTILAIVAHEDPARYRGRTVETEKRKLVKSRARRKEAERREEEEEEN